MFDGGEAFFPGCETVMGGSFERNYSDVPRQMPVTPRWSSFAAVAARLGVLLVRKRAFDAAVGD